jgi:hypothetical protein
MTLKTKFKRQNQSLGNWAINLVNIYGYTADKKYTHEERQTLYEQASEHLSKDKGVTNIVAGDFNARIIEPNINESVGKYIFPSKELKVENLSESNRSSHDTFMEFAVTNHLRVANTYIL